VNTVFLVGTIVLILSFIVRLMVMGTAAWLQLAGWLTTLV
jgi:hypothetical protein